MESPAGRTPAPGALPYYVAFSQLLGLTVVAVTGAWLGAYRGGIAWESALQFNVHPLCMIIGLVFLQGDALLVYRVFRNEAKRTTKILHGLLHVLAFVIALVGLVAVFDYHRKKGIADLYSLHSWCGILVFVLFLAQDQVQRVRVRGRPGQRAGPAAGRLRRGRALHPDPRRLEAAPPGGRASALHGLQDADGGRQPQLPVTAEPGRGDGRRGQPCSAAGPALLAGALSSGVRGSAPPPTALCRCCPESCADPRHLCSRHPLG
uniref:Transmembrane ascorbate-dependent reductase CYB561 n=2 Tax=Sus scrofa TaxID=9823 RepID=A0A8D0VBB9_PIG